MNYFPLDSLGFKCKAVMADRLMNIMSPPFLFRCNLNFSQNIHFARQSAASTSLTEIPHVSCWLQRDRKTWNQRTFSLWPHAELLSVTISIHCFHKPQYWSMWPWFRNSNSNKIKGCLCASFPLPLIEKVTHWIQSTLIDLSSHLPVPMRPFTKQYCNPFVLLLWGNFNVLRKSLSEGNTTLTG